MNKIIIAVPGSGKTTALVEVIRNAINAGTDPGAIFAVTFTREAARELRVRCHPGIHASTIHALAYRILRGNNTVTEPEALDSGLFYDEILMQAAQLGNSFTAEILAIDEAQDLSQLQFTFLKSLITRTKHVCIVGDPLQSIFSFNGGDPRYLSEFKKIVPRVQMASLDRSYRIPREIARFINNSFNPAIPITCEHEGGTVSTQVVPESTLLQQMIRAMTDHTGILFRTNAEIMHLVKTLGKRITEVNYTIPLSAHPYVAFASAIVSMGSSVAPAQVRAAAGMLGGLSWASKRVLGKMKEMKLDRQAIDRLFGCERLWYTQESNDVPIMSQKTRKDIYTFIEVLDMYKEFYGKTGADAIRNLFDALDTDGYIVDSMWKESVPDREALIAAVRRKSLLGSETYYTVDNGSTREIMTIHAAKGKEFDNVLLAVNARSIDIYEEEEFRIVYVGCTRAKKSLTVFVPEINTHDHARPNIVDMMNGNTHIL